MWDLHRFALPIYVWPGTDPNTTEPIFAGTDLAVLPATPSNIGWQCSISNTTGTALIYNLSVDVRTTNDLGNQYQILEGLNDNLGGSYRYESGTSMAAANVSGMLALMQDYFQNRTTQTNPSPALLKAMLINGARAVGNYDFQVANSINYQGWGLVNLPNALPVGITNAPDTSAPSFFVDQSPTNALATGDSRTFQVGITTNATLLPLRVTLAWTDPPGNPAAATKLVNDPRPCREQHGHGRHISGQRYSGQ